MAIKAFRSHHRLAMMMSIMAGMLSLSAYAANVTVTVDGLRNANGTVRLKLDGSEAGWNNKAQAAATGHVKAAVNAVSYTFSDIPPGTYGLRVYQDEDDSGKLRTNMLGIPKEGYGFSNNPSVMGMPSFQQVQFTVTKEDISVVIHLKHGI
ncbi:DUF2141 domain-containing protein [Dyella nitratireducens]|uniref:DUF2141 domain-containing protein n=1 Tax=Dyella nitratireducens TaxID=1849580 RepID=A0ABQ1GJ17_9GAMM|nr:DUF2141 domain-containing protein [Dyella nitratireducens]GGA44566.1 hypothetical protein GCM10010981_37170 [Dyella nitratireducens]GLQ41726.1 hypothetical protein GCM10007902_15760 [Dyella nitratireducens]